MDSLHIGLGQFGVPGGSVLVTTMPATVELNYVPLLQVQLIDADGGVRAFEFVPKVVAPYHSADARSLDPFSWQSLNTLDADDLGAMMAYLSIAEYIGPFVPYPPAIAVDAPETLVGSMNETELKIIDFIQRLREYFDSDTQKPRDIRGVPELPSAMPFTSPLDALRAGRVAIRVDLLV